MWVLDLLGEDHSDVATSYNNLGLVYDNQKNYTKAIECYEKSLKIRLRVLGEEHPTVATSYYNLGCVHNVRGSYTKAVGNYEKSLEIRSKALGEEHPHTKNVEKSLNDLKKIILT